MLKRKDGLYQEKMPVTKDGRTVYKYFYGKTKTEVLKKISNFKDSLIDETLFKTVADEWDSKHAASSSYNAHRAYRVPYKTALEYFGDKQIALITPMEIHQYIERIAIYGYAKRTVKGYLSVLNMIFDHAILSGYCTANPARVVAVPANLKTEKRQLPSDTAIETIKASVDLPFGLFAFFLLYTGCRRGEALALTYDDIDFKAKTISITKSMYWEGNKPIIKNTKTEAGERTIILLDVLAQHIPKGKGYLFGGDSPLTNTAFRRRWDKYKKLSGIDVTPHQLRHLFATILYENDIDEKIAQELMGHSSIRVTRDIYTHIRQRKLEETTKLLNDKIKI